MDFTQYHRIELYCSAAYSDLRVTVRVNGQSSGYHSGAISGGGTGSTATALGYLGGGAMLFYEPKAGDDVGTISFYGTNAGSFSGLPVFRALQVGKSEQLQPLPLLAHACRAQRSLCSA